MIKSFFTIIFFLLPILHDGILFAENVREKKIILVEESKQVTDREAREAADSKSEKKTDADGYHANVSVVNCFSVMKYDYTGGRYVNKPIFFRLLSPETIEPDKKYPLVIWLHGVGESGDDNKNQLAHIQLAMKNIAGKNKLDFFILATQCPKDNPSWKSTVSHEGKGDAPLMITDEILNAVIEEYPIDVSRLGVVGICAGGNTAWSYVAKNPGRFASMVTCTASPSGSTVAPFLKTAIWAFNNRDDSPEALKQTQQLVEAVNAAGGNAYQTVQEHGGHDTWTRALRDENVLGWMVLQKLDSWSPPPGNLCYHQSGGTLFVMFGLPSLVIASVLILGKVCFNENRRKD